MKPVLFLLVAVPSMALAKIGETAAQCDARYGPPSSSLSSTSTKRFYRSGAINVVCEFKDDRCYAIFYNWYTGSVVFSNSSGELRFTEGQIAKLLSFNSQGVKWTKKDGDQWDKPYEGIFVTEDGKLQSQVSGLGISIETVASYQEWKNLMTPEEVQKALDQLTK